MRAGLALLLMCLSCTGFAQPMAHEVKAAFAFKFLSFVEWPADALPAKAPIVIGVAGAPDVAAELEEIVVGRQVQDRPVRVRRLAEGERPAGVHLLYLGPGQAPRLLELMRTAPAQPLLLVADWPGALQQGAVINFHVDQQRVRFEVALDQAERRRLHISPRMLAAAHRVVSER
jgi:hypothetical protein